MTDFDAIGDEADRPAESYTDDELIKSVKKGALEAISSAHLDDWQGLQNLGLTSFNRPFENLDSARESQLGEILSRYPLIDLGGGNGFSDALLNKFGIPQYINVDVKHEQWGRDDDLSSDERILTSGKDLLEFMSQFPTDRHANITSNGVLIGDFFPRVVEPELYQSSPEQKIKTRKHQEYIRRLMRHIRRVLPDTGVFMTTRFEFEQEAIQNGLVLDRNLSTFGRSDSGREYPKFSVYRKTPQLAGAEGN